MRNQGLGSWTARHARKSPLTSARTTPAYLETLLAASVSVAFTDCLPRSGADKALKQVLRERHGTP